MCVIGLFALNSCDTSSVDAATETTDGVSAVVDMLFLATTEDSTGTMRPEHGTCHLNEVDLADLPETITAYISSNYPNATIERAGQTADSENYIVGIQKEDGTFAGLIFDSEGNFLEEKARPSKGTEVAVEDLPAAITDYIASNYPEASIAHARQMDDGNYGVLLLLQNDTLLGVGFDSEGNFIAELDMHDKRGMGMKPHRGPKGNH